MTVQDIITRVQNEIEDAVGGVNAPWCDADYILSKLATLSDDIAVRLQLIDLDYSTCEVILPGVPANTIDLFSYQLSGQPLSQMIVPKTVEWRLVGETQEDWEQIERVEKLIDTDTGTGLPGVPITSDDPTVESYEWRQGKLRISACMEAVDLRVRFSGTVISLTNNSKVQIIGLTNVYAYKCCWKIWLSRGGSATLLAGFLKSFESACGDFEGLEVKQKQARPMRLGGRRSNSGTGWGNGYTNPIVNN